MCDEHVEEGTRDYGIYMTRKRQVWPADAAVAVPAFFDALKESFPVLRSSGDWDPGWRINTDKFIVKQKGHWFIPVMKRSGLSSMGRAIIGVSHQHEKYLELVEFTQHMSRDIVVAFSLALKEGIYAPKVAAPPAAAAAAATATTVSTSTPEATVTEHV